MMSWRRLHRYGYRCGWGLVTLTFGLSPIAAMAATATTTFGVNVTVQATCTISATALAFGAYNGAIDNVTSTLSIVCTNTTPYNVGLNAGIGSGATVNNRLMTGSASTLHYALFSNAAMTVNWGQTIGTDTVIGTGTGIAQTLTIYGQIAASQFVAPAVYSDTITAIVTY
jgi:spore coat protein U-like protein